MDTNRKQWAIYLFVHDLIAEMSLSPKEKQSLINIGDIFPQGDFSIHACFIACQAPLLFRSDPSSEPIPYQAPCSATLNPLSSPIQEGSLEHSIT